MSLFIGTATHQSSFAVATNNLLVFRMPKDGTLTRLAVYAATAPSGSAATFDLKVNGVTVLGGPLSLAASDNDNEVIISEPVNEGDLIRVDLLSTPSSIGNDLAVHVDFEVAEGGSLSGVILTAPVGSNVTLANGNNDYVTWENGADRDDGGWFDGMADDQLLTVPTGHDGWKTITGSVNFGVGTATGKLFVSIELNGNNMATEEKHASTTEFTNLNISITLYLVAGDEIRLNFQNTSGASISTAYGFQNFLSVG